MQLGTDETTLRLGGEIVHLRPSLRAALRLERRHGGFGKLLGAVSDGNLGIIADVIRESATRPSCVPDLLIEFGKQPLRTGLGAVIPALIDHVLALAGVDSDQPTGEASSAEPISFADYHTRLFEIATGAIGWPPAVAWDATPAEIMAAWRGRCELLKMMFGSADKTPSDPLAVPSEAERATGIATLRTIVAGGR
jgi:hypothetical protein